jgi:hypothetical protein
MALGRLNVAALGGYSAAVGRAGTILLLAGFAGGALLATGTLVVANAALRAVAVFIILTSCLVGAALLTASFARSSRRYYKARAERRSKS